MERRARDRRLARNVSRALIVALALLASLLAGCGLPRFGAPPASIEARWGDAGDYVPITSSTVARPAGARELRLRVTPPPMRAVSPAFLMTIAWGLGDREITQGGVPLPMRADSTLVELRDPSTPVEIVFRARHAFSGDAILPSFSFGDADELTSEVVRSDAGQFAVGALLLLAGLPLLLTGLARGSTRAYWTLGLYIAPIGTLLMGQTDRLSIALTSSWSVVGRVHDLSNWLYPTGFALLVREVFGQGRDRFLAWAARVAIVATTISLALDVTGIATTFVTRRPANVVVYAIAAWSVRLTLPLARRGDRSARLFLGGLSFAVLASTRDLLQGMGLVTHQVLVSHWGLLVLVGAFALLLELRTRATLAEVRARTVEVTTLNEELRRKVKERSEDLVELLRRAHPESPKVEGGDVIDGRYRVERELGRGGMGAVFEVVRASDGRRFAIKVLTGRVLPNDAARFAREAAIAASFDHENLVAVRDLGVSGERLYLVMELVAGESLEARRATFGPTRENLRVLEGVARGLAELHARGVIHRDLKPGNVLVTTSSSGEPLAKITDFGISILDAREEAATSREADRSAGAGARLTATNAWIGTPAYMAPELAKDGRAIAASDVFAFGVLAFEVLTGDAPFKNPALFEAAAGRTPAVERPLASRGLDLPERVACVVDAALASDPDARPSARDVAAAFAV